MSDRKIAGMLNEDGIPSPGKSRNRNAKGARTDGKWMHTTIRAILRNETYVGSLVWNRYRWRKKPGSSVRARRIRPKSEWIRVEQKIGNATAAILDGGLGKSDALAIALKDVESQKEQLLTRLASTTLPELDSIPDIVPRAIERYRAEVGRLEQLGDNPKPEHVVRARAALRTLFGEIWLQPNGDHLVAHVELQNQALALISGNVANGGSGGRISSSALRAPVALAADRDACVAAAASEPASSQVQISRGYCMRSGA